MSAAVVLHALRSSAEAVLSAKRDEAVMPALDAFERAMQAAAELRSADTEALHVKAANWRST